MKIGNFLGIKNITKEETESTYSNSNVGLEIELENILYQFSSDSPEIPNSSLFYRDQGILLPSISSHWKVVKDNSLRKGCEFIFDKPKMGTKIKLALKALNSLLKKYRLNGSTVKVSDRCSIHLHLDVRDITLEQLNNILLIYVLTERVLFEYVNPSRIKNNYCRPITDSHFKNILVKLLSNYSPFQFPYYNIKDSCEKYSALNLLPILTFGSIEFRHHQGSYDIKEIEDWVNIIISYKVNKNINIKDIIDIYNTSGYKEVLLKLFKNTALEKSDFIDRAILKSLIKKGITDVLELLNYSKLNELSTLATNKNSSFKVKSLFKNEDLKSQYVKIEEEFLFESVPNITEYPL